MRKIILITLLISTTMFVYSVYAENNENFEEIKARWNIEVSESVNYSYEEITEVFIKENPNLANDFKELMQIFEAIDQNSIDSLNQ